MSCPYFYPVRLRSQSGPAGALFPLGACWSGECRTAPEAPAAVDEGMLRSACNLGYARGRCPRFPAEPAPDAARFTIRADDGATVRLYYVQERDHHPFAHGALEYSRAQAALVDPPPDGNLARQAQAYTESYLLRKNDVSASDERK